MLLHEPITMLTDYGMAVEAGLFAWLLLKVKQGEPHRYAVLWSLAFGCVALAAVLGGTLHGFLDYLEAPWGQRLWQSMIYVLSIASSLMLLATVTVTTAKRWRRWCEMAVVVKFGIYLHWAIGCQDYLCVVIDYLSAMGLLLLFESYARWDQPCWGISWRVTGVVVSCLAVGVQGSEWRLDPLLNHNDLYHLIQMVGLWLFYQGVRKFRISESAPAEPTKS
jgi:hypothetical protein